MQQFNKDIRTISLVDRQVGTPAKSNNFAYMDLQAMQHWQEVVWGQKMDP